MDYLKIFNTAKNIYDFIKPMLNDDKECDRQYSEYVKRTEVVKPIETIIDKTPVSSDNIVHNNVYYLINSCNTYSSNDSYIMIDGVRYDKLFVPIKEDD